MDFGRAFTFLTEDSNWIVKLAIGAGIVLISPFLLLIPLFLILGYQVAVTRQVLAGKDVPLPEWFDELGRLFKDGFFVWIAQIAYTIPFWLLACIGVAASFAFGFIGDQGAGEVAGIGLVAVYAVLSCLGIIFLIALFFISPAIIIQYVQTDDFGACFRFGEVLGIARDNVGPILMSALALFVVSFLLSFVQLIPCIGQIVGLFTVPYMGIATGHLYGQIARNMGSKPAGAY
jgi:hypothetical protein